MTLLPPALPMLRTFEAVARLGSFSQASREIGVTPSAISQQMGLLEGRLGVALFERHARGLAVTAEGKRLAADVADALGRLDCAMAQLVDADARGPLTVSTVGSFAQQWLVPRLAWFRKAYPQVDLLLVAEQRPVDLRTREADLAIRFGSGDYPGLWSRPLLLDHVVPVTSPGWAARLATTPTLQTLVQTATLIHDEGIGSFEPALSWARWIRDCGATPRGGSLRFGDSILALEATLAGEGVMLARCSIARRLLDAGHIVRPVDDWKITDGAYHLVAPQGGPTGAAAAFADWVDGEAGRFDPRLTP